RHGRAFPAGFQPRAAQRQPERWGPAAPIWVAPWVESGPDPRPRAARRCRQPSLRRRQRGLSWLRLDGYEGSFPARACRTSTCTIQEMTIAYNAARRLATRKRTCRVELELPSRLGRAACASEEGCAGLKLSVQGLTMLQREAKGQCQGRG